MLHRCTGCSPVFSDPQPREEVQARYRETYDLAAHFGAREPRKTILYERRLAASRVPPPVTIGSAMSVAATVSS